jgi:hypothetical protein
MRSSTRRDHPRRPPRSQSAIYRLPMVQGRAMSAMPGCHRGIHGKMLEFSRKFACEPVSASSGRGVVRLVRCGLDSVAQVPSDPEYFMRERAPSRRL